MKKIYRTFMELVPEAVGQAIAILEEHGVKYIVEFNEENRMYWLLFMTPDYEIPAKINRVLDIRGRLDGEEVSA